MDNDEFHKKFGLGDATGSKGKEFVYEAIDKMRKIYGIPN